MGSFYATYFAVRPAHPALGATVTIGEANVVFKSNVACAAEIIAGGILLFVFKVLHIGI